MQIFIHRFCVGILIIRKGNVDDDMRASTGTENLPNLWGPTFREMSLCGRPTFDRLIQHLIVVFRSGGRPNMSASDPVADTRSVKIIILLR